MKILILRSVKTGITKNQYSICMDTLYADRFIGNITDKGTYCSACGKKCVSCRSHYRLDFSSNIAGVIDFPSVLPAIIDEPEEYLPDRIPSHDVIIAVAVNEEILISFVKKFSESKGIIVPIERSNVISPHAVSVITELCSEKGIEISFPKPFCAFSPAGGVLKAFMEYFRIGKPSVDFNVENGTITEAKVITGAPCGATYFTARGLAGKNVDDDLPFIIDKQLSSYPCTADTAVDREFKDSITHQAVKIQRDVLLRIKKEL